MRETPLPETGGQGPRGANHWARCTRTAETFGTRLSCLEPTGVELRRFDCSIARTKLFRGFPTKQHGVRDREAVHVLGLCFSSSLNVVLTLCLFLALALA